MLNLRPGPAGPARARRGCRLPRGIAGLAGLVALGLLLCPGAAFAAAGGRVTRLRPASGGATVSLVLPLRADLTGLEAFASAVSTPGSPLYGQYESVALLARRFGAPAAARARVISVLRLAGARDVRIDPTGLSADATMTVAGASRLFAAPLVDEHSAVASRYIAPAGQPLVPPALQGAVTGVVGLNTAPIIGGAPSEGARGGERSAVVHFGADAASGYPRRTGTAAGCSAATAQSGFTPNQYLTAYGYAPLHAAGLNGQGERVALIEIDGFKYADLKRFAACFGLAVPAINGYGVDLKKPLPAGSEATLDLEVLDAAAPRLRAIDVYESQPDAADVLRSLTAPLSNRGAKPNVISASLGACELQTIEAIGRSGLRTVEGSLALAAASGISVLASSGDDGSSACLSQSGNPQPGLAVSYPASSPWVTGVGGTNVTLNAANQITGQQVWNDAPLIVAAGGGGTSAIFDRPAYQSGVVSGKLRVVPDVSMLADIAPGYEIYCSARDCVSRQHPQPWLQVGGTSAAAPLLAGGLAIVDQDLRAHARQDIGLANPLLYTIARLPGAASVISDVTTGDNDLGRSIDGRPFGCCTAGPGYDAASGLGSVNVGALAGAAQSIVPALVSITLSLPRQRDPLVTRRLIARVTCSGRCLYGAYARIRIGRRRTIERQSRAYLRTRAGGRTISIALSGPTVALLRRALAHRERIVASLYGVILDPAGNVEAQSRARALRISG
jgi:subtilase family serine protease